MTVQWHKFRICVLKSVSKTPESLQVYGAKPLLGTKSVVVILRVGRISKINLLIGHR